MRAQGLINDEEFLRHRKIILNQRNALESQGSRQTVDVAEVREKFKEIVMPLIHLRQTWKTIQPPFRRRFERLVLPAGFAIGHSRTVELGGLFSTFRELAHPVSIGVAPALSGSNPIIPDIIGFWEILRIAEGREEELLR